MLASGSYEVCAWFQRALLQFAEMCVDLELGEMEISWQKTFREENMINRSQGQNTLALSAFLLSSLPTPHMKKALVKQMWESGADVLVGNQPPY